MNTVYVLQNQSLLEQSIPVFIGVFAAFLFSVATLRIELRINDRNSKKKLLSNLLRELRYNLSVISDIQKSIDVVMPKILSGDKTPYWKVKYAKFMTPFIQQAYSNGVLFEILSEYDLAVFDDLLSHYSNGGSEAWLRSRIEEWQKDKIEQKAVIYSFQSEKDELDIHVRVINDVISKIKIS